jgi:hypothetical protein
VARCLPAPARTRAVALVGTRLPVRVATRVLRAHTSAGEGGGRPCAPALAAPDAPRAAAGLAALAAVGGAVGVALPAAGALLLVLPGAGVPGRPGLCRAVLLHGLSEFGGGACGGRQAAVAGIERVGAAAVPRAARAAG